jgi:hypothetical protein
MAKRITITIPDEMHKKLENYRDRINISAICASALRKTMDGVDNMVREAKRRFFLLSVEEACDMAFEEGLRWAGEDAKVSELRFVCEGVPVQFLSDDEVIELSLDTYESVNEYIVENELIWDLVYRFREEGAKSTEKPITKSFIKGAMTVWKGIKNDKLLEELKKHPYDRRMNY